MQLTRYARALVPSGLKSLVNARALRREHGLVSLGNVQNRQISPASSFGRFCRIGGRVYLLNAQIGDYSYVEDDVRISHAVIGRFTAIAPGVQIGLAAHPLENRVTTHPAFYQHRPEVGYDFVSQTNHDEFKTTRVGNDVWIGADVLVRDGVTVGDGAIVGAGAVITKDVPPYTIVAGVPGRIIRERFDGDTIEFLLRLRWWDRSDAWLRDHAHLMNDVARLRAAVGSFTDGEGSSAS